MQNASMLPPAAAGLDTRGSEERELAAIIEERRAMARGAIDAEREQRRKLIEDGYAAIERNGKCRAYGR